MGHAKLELLLAGNSRTLYLTGPSIGKPILFRINKKEN